MDYLGLLYLGWVFDMDLVVVAAWIDGLGIIYATILLIVSCKQVFLAICDIHLGG